jgi:class 3 adenylate cyclase/HPt (histidine-containing phosphotransfer) domain-containing protein
LQTFSDLSFKLEQQGKSKNLDESVEIFGLLKNAYISSVQILKALLIEIGGTMPTVHLAAESIEKNKDASIVSDSSIINDEMLARLQTEFKNMLIQVIGEEDQELIDELVISFYETGNVLLQDILQAYEKQDSVALHQAAHTLKSSSANLGAVQVSDLCKKIEKIAKSGEIEKISALLPILEKEYKQATYVLSSLVQKQPATIEQETIIETPATTQNSEATRATNTIDYLPIADQVRILVIDDQPYETLLTSNYLKEEGYHVLIANDGETALQLLEEESPDIVLSDVLMPGMDGFEVCREIKQRPNSILTPVILITALESREDRIQGIRAGADEFLSKPINREELVARVHSLLRFQNARKSLEHQQNEQLKNLFKRYMSPALVEEVLTHPEKAEFALQDRKTRQDAVVLFADLRGFTAMSESLEPMQVVSLLNEFFSMLTDMAYKHEGTIFNMAGDCLLIGFGVPFSQENAVPSAIQASLDMQKAFCKVQQAWKGIYQGPVGLGIGLNKGEMIVGNVGSADYMNYTVIGDTVNVASRLTGLADAGEIILSHNLFSSMKQALVERLNIQEIEPVMLKGKSQPQQVYRISPPQQH